MNNYFKLFIVLIILNFNNYCYADSIFKIAIIAPFSGPYLSYGKQLLIATNKQIINNNLNMELIPFDDQCNINTAKTIAHQVIQDKNIKAVITYDFYGNNEEINNLYAKYKLLHFIINRPNTALINNTNNINTLFYMSGSKDNEAQSICNFVAKQFNNKNIAILHSQNLYHKEFAEQLQEYLVTINIFPKVYQNIPINHFNRPKKINAIFKKLKNLNVDIIIFSGLYQEIADFIKFMYNKKLNIPIITTSNIATLGFLTQLGSHKIASGTMISFQKLTPQLLANHSIDLAIFGEAAIQAINSAKISNPNKSNILLAHWLHQNKVNTLLGEKSWDPNGYIINDDFAIYMLDSNGHYSLVE